ncbi:MAG: hypothetical protein ABIR70_02750 [Bryobacteraceae bacterium]
MERATVRDLHLKTSAMLKEVAEGHSFVIENRGVPVAELRPFLPVEVKKFPDRSAFLKTLKPSKTDSGRILEEDRS